MSKMLEYKGYHATVEYDYDDKILVGKVYGLSDSLNFHGSSDDIENMFHQTVDNYLDFCESIGKTPEKEYSGVFNVRTSSDLHKRLSEFALKNDMTINAVVNDALEIHLQEKSEKHSTIPYTILPMLFDTSKYQKNNTSIQTKGSFSYDSNFKTICHQ
ncbi:MAG: type II toxin-antitoxin system HicB family antitoxin [Clostridia bacterium]|nr:type II toxin-antitoxin system HicB family antitoxin [Clostridia bacterium]